MALGALLTAGAFTTSPPPRQGAPATPLGLFQKMLPVIRHPRCANCHGGVDPLGTGAGHGPGRIATTGANAQQCTDCHEPKEWKLPAADHFFVRRTDKQLCGIWSDFQLRTGYDNFFRHLLGDELIANAFEGDAGGQLKPPDKPPIGYDSLIVLATAWMDQGHGACEVEGTINQEETVDVAEGWSMAPGTTDSVIQKGHRTVKVTIGAGGSYRADITVDGTIDRKHTAQSVNAAGRPCTITMILKTHYYGTTRGPAKVVAKDTLFYAGTQPSLGMRDYRLDVTLPKETNQRDQSGVVNDGCGSGIPAPDPSSEELAWDEYHFTLEGRLNRPADKNLVGSCDKVVRDRDIGSMAVERSSVCNRFAALGNAEHPWLMHHGADVAFHDGSDVPFRVVTSWNIRFRK